MIAEPLIIIALCIIAYGVASERLGRSPVSAPMVFMAAGLATGKAGLGLVDIGVDSKVLQVFGEMTLGLILFSDAAGTNARKLVHRGGIPSRLLLVGLPLAMAIGTAVAVLVLPGLAWQECALIAAILAPTDAALGLAVVTSRAAPERIRQAVLVESGLNDGLALPAVLILAALAFSAIGEGGKDVGYWSSFALKQIALGAGVGAGIGYGLGLAIRYADKEGWIARSYRKLVTIGVAILTLFCAHAAGGNGFIATFVGGLVFGGVCSARAGSLTEFVSEEGQLFSLIVFFIFGAALLPEAFGAIDARTLLYAGLSLTLIRMSATALALLGAGLKPASVAFIGWFGPRGLASILFLLIVIERQELGRVSAIEAAVYATVFFSVILHGATAAPLARVYGKSAAAKADA